MSSHSDPSVFDVAVVGSGLAGLTAAAILCRSGASVLVLDAHGGGGRARSIHRDGFTLNDGPHALYKGGAAARVLSDLGIEPKGGDPALDKAGVWVEGSPHRLPVSPAAMLRSKVLRTRSKLTAARIMPAMMKGTDDRAAGRSLAEWLDDRGAPDDLGSMVEMYVRLSTYTNIPEQLSATAALSQFALAQEGVWYLDDGWQQLVDALRALVDGPVRHDAPLRELVRDAGQWALSTDDSEVRASHVVLATGGPATAARLAGCDPEWIERAGPPARAACLDLGVRREVQTPVLLSMDGPHYGSSHAPPARLAPDGAGLIGVMRYLAPDERPDRTATHEELLRHAERMGVRPDDVTFDRYLHDMTASHGTPLADRARPRGDELAGDNLWVAGDWVDSAQGVGPVPLLADAALGSAASAAGAIVEKLERAR